jgi:hemolysin activation/secretion protein
MRRIVTILWASFLVVQAHAQIGSELAPRELEKGREGKLSFGEREAVIQEGVDESAVLMRRLGAIELNGGEEGSLFHFDVTHVGEVRGQGLTVELDGLGEALLSFLGRPLTENGLDRLLETVLRYYEAHDRPVTDAFAPVQDLKDGTLLLEVIEGRIGTLGIQSGDIFNDELLAGAVQLDAGDPLLSSDLQEHLDWFNRNPFRPAALYAAPGVGEGDADIVFAFTERRPWRGYAGYENSGAEAAGESRYLLGFNWGNAFGLDQVINYQFTMGGSLEELSAHALGWELPIHPWHHFVRLSGSFADLSTESRSAGMKVISQGTSWQLGGAYGIQLRRWKNFKQEVSFGAEFKSSDNFLVFGGGDAHPGSLVEVLQLRTDYRASRQFKSGALEVRASLVGSPGGLSGRNEDEDFARFRAGAESGYLYGRAQAIWVHRLPKGWSLRTRGQLQLASGSLLPTEQLALGGHTTVRGYEEREFLGDHGYGLSAEVRAPAIEVPIGAWLPTQVQLLSFLDHGTGWRDETGVGEEASKSFTSLGMGARVQAGSAMSIRGDLGVPLEEGGGVRAHLGVTVSF